MAICYKINFSVYFKVLVNLLILIKNYSIQKDDCVCLILVKAKTDFFITLVSKCDKAVCMPINFI